MTNTPDQSSSPVAIIGAGPVGLAAAAHAVQRGFPVIVFEAGDDVADNLASYRQVRLFSPWRYNVDRAARALLQATGWSAPDDEALPSAGELIDGYLRPLARTPALAPHIRFGARVIAISREGFDKVKTAGRERADFVLQVQTAAGVHEQRARSVIDASGTWSQPNPLGAHGLPAVGEVAARAQIVHGMPDILGAARARYAGRKVLVVGAGHSAAGNLLALATLAEQEPGTRVAWAVRGTDLRRLFGGGENDGLPARGALGTRLRALVERGQLELHRGFAIRELVPGPEGLRVLAVDPGKPAIEGVDEIIASTGARPDLGIARELRLRLDPWLESTDALAPLIDPNLHSCGTVRPHGHRELAHPEPGFYAIGAKSYGRAPNFLMATGYEQARSVVAALAGDLQAADDVQLELPETGVCSVNLAGPDLSADAAACCGGPAQTDASACCVLDETAKAEGKAGCGCGPKKSAPAVATATACCR
jgi:thioredoxin reductase